VAELRVPELAALDLNLLVAFEALFAERSVTRAGRRLGLSQPATSGALARLRVMLRDELFVRGKLGLVPTSRCAELAAPIGKALTELRAALSAGAFEPASSERTFTIGGVDAVLAVLGPAVLGRLLSEAPRARFVITPIDPADAIPSLEAGALDLAIAVVGALPTTVGARELFRVEGLLCMRPGHPLAKRPLVPGDLTRFPHVMVSFVGSARSQIDEALDEQGQSRHVAIVLGSFLAVPPVLRETDALAVLPAPLARKLASEGQLVVAPLPRGLPFPDLRMRMLWPLAEDASPASRWLRGVVASVAAELIER
jgi:LysR family transcriptional activator of mexEF-oprN operon